MISFVFILLLLFIFIIACWVTAQALPRTGRSPGGRTGGSGGASASGAGRLQLREMETQADPQEDAARENRRPKNVPVEPRDQGVHGPLGEELE